MHAIRQPAAPALPNCAIYGVPRCNRSQVWPQKPQKPGVVFPARWNTAHAVQCAANISTSHINSVKISIVYGAVFAGFHGELDLVREQMESLEMVGLFSNYLDVDIEVHIVLSFGQLRQCLARTVATYRMLR